MCVLACELFRNSQPHTQTEGGREGVIQICCEAVCSVQLRLFRSSREKQNKRKTGFTVCAHSDSDCSLYLTYEHIHVHHYIQVTANIYEISVHMTEVYVTCKIRDLL